MLSRFLIIFCLILLSFACKAEKDSSNDPAQLLLRFLVRNVTKSVIDPELPSNVSVAVPRSIRKTSDGSGFAVRNNLAPKDFNSLRSEGGTGVGILQDATTVISAILQDSKRDLILISSVYGRAKAAPGSCIPGGATNITISDEVIAEIIEGLKRIGLSDTEASADLVRLQNLGVAPRVGQSVPSPAIVYKPSSDKAYDHEVYFSFSDTISAPKTCPTNINEKNAFEKNLKWKNDKSQVFSSVQKTLRFLTVTVNIDASITYFTEAGKKDRTILVTKQTTKFSPTSSNEVSKRLTVEECLADTEENSDNCISLSYKARDRRSASLTIQTDVIGKTGNNGGLVNTKISPGLTAAGPKIEIDEYFNADGVVDWIEYYEDDGSGLELVNGFGTLDGVEYSFDKDNLFEEFVELIVDFGCVGSCIAESAPEDYSAEDYFVLAFDGEDPNEDEEFIWGYGYYFDDNTSGDYDDINEIYIEYWGEEEDVPSVRVWRWLYDEVEEKDYYILLDDTVSVF
ncbi:hypothetical protein [Leptospira sp. GIMC2001]|uniref:hypothetical protein n=1 Tax=Leptospira sp. GIMC2001 TaxID=1513297 RepID=UPI00234900FB|nr:hypothetical protein [Leptospira sp. GIMC2001]WCL48127.1 hypothetical protein O4O04_12475 [Leptospira sp. GIMC2001]